MTKQINVLTTTDIHGFIANMGEQPALAFEGLKEKYPHSLLMDSGDFFVGNPLTTFFCDQMTVSPLADYANAIGFDVMVPGNHDFDHGINYLKEQVKHLNADYVCCNAFSEEDELLFPPFAIKEINGIKVGVIGLVTSRMSMISDFPVTRGVIVKTALPELQKQVAVLRDQVDLILVGYHGGIERDLATHNEINYATGEDETFKLVSQTPGIDGFSCGHQHRVNHGQIGQTLIVQCGYRGNYYGHLTFEFDDYNKITQRKEEVVASETLPVKARSFYDEQEYQEWLSEELDLSQLVSFLQEKFARTNLGIFINLQGKTRKQVIDSFTIPYGVRIYHLTKSEYTTFSQQPWTLKEEHSPNDAQDFVVLTNSYDVPEYRLTEQFVDNIFDEYSYYLKQRG
ncbi:bifunctional metallophosphatase/5'-nucleotidase [Lactobacillus bombicola]|uniref:2,' 3'-cyclic nucleotide 2'-phosphodiesterase n=1 Tax=Lactobacillus bombicola TaxID=1505723 RepID=A0ABX9LXY8_9LACO|nr:metallophosphoesterase [Lactobacillus bombicola]RHW48919.1 2,' 3'-cyclic nucleotide 2'-phosphodiesterase [Lactobacillus bombicola]RHW53628.1 2,' 3'-cyclic nucleotide 2'-phosphodiesterase [Lactobacillus bombicola]